MPNLRHAFASAKSDSSDSSLIRPSNWNAKLQYTDGSGAPSGTDAVVREVLTADRTYYIRTDGSDSNTGLVNNAGGAWLTLAHAWTVLASTLDFGGFTVTLQFADGTYTLTYISLVDMVGGGEVVLQGNTGDKTAVTLTTSTEWAVLEFDFLHVVTVRIRYVTLTSTTGGSVLLAIYGLGPVIFDNIKFGSISSGFAAFDVGGSGASATFVNDHTIATGNLTAFVFLHSLAAVGWNPGTVTITGTPAWTSGFVFTSELADFAINSSVVFSGSATGPRYEADSNSVINTFGAGATFLPGNAAGSTSTGGIYV